MSLDTIPAGDVRTTMPRRVQPWRKARCYNERTTIEHVVAAVLAAPMADKEIIVVDDCSTDGTQELLRTDVVFGSRFSGCESHRVLYFWHAVGD